jgi:hypothetical protein
MNKYKRIKVNINDLVDNNIKFKLEQNVDTYKFLSLNLTQQEIYQSFNADFGVLVGRVNANESVGIPNAKVSIFIPIDDEDINNPEIYQYYPYEKPTDENLDGKRYNLLPRISRVNEDGELKPNQPFGSFPIKEEFLSNETLLEVYEKYYKYTTVTNNSGDYMIFGVPTGTQTVHMSVDITDIGKYSMSPSTMVTNLGYSPNLFTAEGNTIKPATDLNNLPNIETQEISVDIIPFWGDRETYEIGITRQDFKIRAELTQSVVIFGTTFTGSAEGIWGNEDYAVDDLQIYEINGRVHPNDTERVGKNNMRIDAYRIDKPEIKVFTYNQNVEINDILNKSDDIDITTDISLLDKSEYGEFIRNGDFALNIECNRSKVITDEAGNEQPVDDDSVEGIFTEFYGYITVEYGDNLPMNLDSNIGRALRGRVKIPQDNRLYIPPDDSDDSSEAITARYNNNYWVKNSQRFEGGKYYGISMKNHIQFREGNEYNAAYTDNDVINYSGTSNFGLLLMNIIPSDKDNYANESGMLPNGINGYGEQVFGGEWLNLSIYLPQYKDDRRDGGFHTSPAPNPEPYDIYWLYPNTQPLGGTEVDTSRYLRGDLYKTGFVEISKTDLANMFEYDFKGLRKDNEDNPTQPFDLESDFYVEGYKDGNPAAGDETNPYIYKGLQTADCIKFVYQNNLV